MNLETDVEKLERLAGVVVKSHQIYLQKSEIWCPYFSGHVALNSEGFNHLLNKINRTPRSVDEQLLKLSLLGKALEIIKKSGTLQGYRDTLQKAHEPGKDGFYKTSRVQYWSFDGLVGSIKIIKITAIVKKIGDGKLTFWSVMPCGHLRNQKLYTAGIEDE